MSLARWTPDQQVRSAKCFCRLGPCRVTKSKLTRFVSYLKIDEIPYGFVDQVPRMKIRCEDFKSLNIRICRALDFQVLT